VTNARVNSEFVIAKKMLPRGEDKNRTTAPIVSIPGRISPMPSPGPLLPGGRLKPILREVVVVVVVVDSYCCVTPLLYVRWKLLEGSVGVRRPPNLVPLVVLLPTADRGKEGLLFMRWAVGWMIVN